MIYLKILIIGILLIVYDARMITIIKVPILFSLRVFQLALNLILNSSGHHSSKIFSDLSLTIDPLQTSSPFHSPPRVSFIGTSNTHIHIVYYIYRCIHKRETRNQVTGQKPVVRQSPIGQSIAAVGFNCSDAFATGRWLTPVVQSHDVGGKCQRQLQRGIK